jgi:hypothetical protein
LFKYHPKMSPLEISPRILPAISLVCTYWTAKWIKVGAISNAPGVFTGYSCVQSVQAGVQESL